MKPTEYALEHADKCCFVMTVQQTWNQDDSEYSYMTYFLNRPANPGKNSKASIILDDSHNSYLTQKMEEPEKIRNGIDGMIELLEQRVSGVFLDKVEEKELWMIEGFLLTILYIFWILHDVLKVFAEKQQEFRKEVTSFIASYIRKTPQK